MADLPTNNLKMLTLVTPEGRLELSLADGPVTPPTADQVVVKVLAAPINPSDLGLLVGAADMSTARATQKNGHPAVEADIPPAGMRAMAGRVGEAMPIGNEASGVVIAAGVVIREVCVEPQESHRYSLVVVGRAVSATSDDHSRHKRCHADDH
mgnify:CR=1 FL=1